MKDYSAMSDFEINKAVDDVLHPPKPRHIKAYNSNYCNNPADAWPIIIDNRIAILPAPQQGEWKAAHRAIGEDSTPHFFNQSANGLRAAMIVYLQMMEQKP